MIKKRKARKPLEDIDRNLPLIRTINGRKPSFAEDNRRYCDEDDGRDRTRSAWMESRVMDSTVRTGRSKTNVAISEIEEFNITIGATERKREFSIFRDLPNSGNVYHFW